MAAGIPFTQQSVNQQVGALTVALRNDFAAIVNMNASLTAQPGGAHAFLVTLGFLSADADVIIATLGNLAALAAIYQGGTPGGTLNYMTNSNALWGGQ
jgi:hypothetical protein